MILFHFFRRRNQEAMKTEQLFLALTFALFIFVVVQIATGKCRSRENYRDPLWMQPSKLYQDHYPRANGSIYGTRRGGWDLFSGVNFYPRAY